LPTKPSNPTGKVAGVVAVDQHQREQQLAPRGREDEAERCRNARQRQWQDDLPERGELRGAIDHRRLFQILRNTVEEGLHQEGRERHVEGGVDDDKAGVRLLVRCSGVRILKIGATSMTSGNICVSSISATIQYFARKLKRDSA
jgi:hypothetical protein